MVMSGDSGKAMAVGSVNRLSHCHSLTIEWKSVSESTCLSFDGWSMGWDMGAERVDMDGGNPRLA